ncbi:MAG TPA: hypothetical protein PLN52_13360 [Opitutaceae bacterium]|nr:hypothetical protein [Opitutaceae bacterium]
MDSLRDILRRIERETGCPNLVQTLGTQVEPADLHSLLLAVFRERSRQRTPAQVLTDYLEQPLMRPCAIDPRVFLAWDQTVYRFLPPTVTPLELSPVSPFASHAAIATVSQDKTLVTSRGAEVISDATNVLALEAASRRRSLLRQTARDTTRVSLASSQRLVRTHFAAYPHFRLFHLVTAGRDTGDSRFECPALNEHLSIFLHALEAFLPPEVTLRVSLTDLTQGAREARWQERVLSPLHGVFPSVQFQFDPERLSGRGYYQECCFKLHAQVDGEWLEIGDGGFTDWTQRLLSDRKERLLISAAGSDRICGLVTK